MCGIAGFFSFRADVKIDRHQLLSMTNILSHRGPDDSGVALFNYDPEPFDPERQNDGKAHAGSVGLGHRRLSIIDLSEKGHQPMETPDGSVWMVYNGEVYNYVELRNELEKLGYRFSSTSDSEVVLQSYCAWGTDCFRRFNGMWALALYDRKKRIVILSRDRFGKKPLYYYRDNDAIFFASEIKALLKCPEVKKEINLKKIINYAGRHYRYVDNDNESFFRNIVHVPKSSYMVVQEDGTSFCKNYWRLQQGSLLDETYSESDLVERFKELLRDAVTIRLRSDVPVGSMLSGGMDSTSITCLAVERNSNFTAFSGVTGSGYYDESEYIQEVVHKTGVHSEFVYPEPTALFPTLREMLHIHDEPVCTVTWYSMYLITKQIASHKIPVILTGHGGDELVAGYWDHYHYHFSDLRRAGEDDTFERRAYLANHRRDPSEYEREKAYINSLHQNHRVEIQKFSRYLSCLSPELLNNDEIPDLSCQFEGDLARRLYLELLYETVPPVLRAEDRNMMAFSIENRVPFLDYRLAEFCFGLSNRYKIRNGLGKWILREAMKDILPEKVRCRNEKVGHNVPVGEWFRKENRAEVEELIARKSYVNESIYNQAAVRELFHNHLAGADHYMFFWQYINLNLWMDLHFS